MGWLPGDGRGPSGARGHRADDCGRGIAGGAASERIADFGIISFDGTLTEPARKRLADRIKEVQSDDSMGVLLLDQAAKSSPR
jgi:hypothetical protein